MKLKISTFLKQNRRVLKNNGLVLNIPNVSYSCLLSPEESGTRKEWLISGLWKKSPKSWSWWQKEIIWEKEIISVRIAKKGRLLFAAAKDSYRHFHWGKNRDNTQDAVLWKCFFQGIPTINVLNVWTKLKIYFSLMWNQLAWSMN